MVVSYANDIDVVFVLVKLTLKNKLHKEYADCIKLGNFFFKKPLR